MSTALSVTFLKEHCPHCLQWLMCFPPIGQTGHMTILDAREMGKNLLMLVAQMVKRLLTMQETWVRSLGQEDPLEKEMATHSSTLAWRIPWTEEPGRLQPMGLQRVGHD